MQETHLETGLILELERSHGGGHGNLLQYSCLEKLMDRGASSPRGHQESDMTEATEHSWTWLSRFLCNIVLYSIRLYFHLQLHPQLDIVSTLTQALLSFWSYFSTLLKYWAPTTMGSSSFSYLFAFSYYCSWGSQGKDIEVVCHSLLQWTSFCQNPPSWPVHLGWPYMAWHSFIELDKAMIHVISLVSFLWLWFSFCLPSDRWG